MTKIPLNLHEVVMAKPDKCLKGWYDNFLVSENVQPFDRYCKVCEYRIGEDCVYREHTVEIAHGDFEYNDSECHYVQFNCGHCGELIKVRDKVSWIYYNFEHETHTCKHCNTAHRVLRSTDYVYTFAVPVKVMVNEEQK
jgi:hypothetical protein